MTFNKGLIARDINSLLDTYDDLLQPLVTPGYQELLDKHLKGKDHSWDHTVQTDFDKSLTAVRRIGGKSKKFKIQFSHRGDSLVWASFASLKVSVMFSDVLLRFLFGNTAFRTQRGHPRNNEMIQLLFPGEEDQRILDFSHELDVDELKRLKKKEQQSASSSSNQAAEQKGVASGEESEAGSEDDQEDLGHGGGAENLEEHQEISAEQVHDHNLPIVVAPASKKLSLAAQKRRKEVNFKTFQTL